jgi:DNA-directed RNA polymerase subunit F
MMSLRVKNIKGNNMNTSSVSRFNALRASVSNVVQLPLPIEGFPSEKQGNGKSGNDKGWNYLLSNTVSFSKTVDHAIRIQKPEREKIPEWISKLITGGQCKTLYVENIDLDLQPTDSEMIRKLCELYSVSLVNVRVNSINDVQNVALGPW